MNVFLARIALLISIWSYAICLYIPHRGVLALEFKDLLSAFFLALVPYVFTLLQMEARGRLLASRSGMLSIMILAIPLIGYAILGARLNQFLFVSAPFALMSYALFSRPLHVTRLEKWGCCVLYATLSVFFIFGATGISPNYDIWQVYALSQSYSGDFYYMDYIRQNYLLNHYGVAFPYICTFFLFLVDLCVQWDLHSYLVVNFISLLLFLFIIRKIFYQFAIKERWPLVGLICLLYLHTSREIPNGGTSIFNIWLIMLIAYVVISNRHNYLKLLSLKCASCLGALFGVGLMIRFDFVAFAATGMSLYLVYALANKKYKSAFAFVLVFFAVISPWIIYSLTHFNDFFTTDNGRRVINIPDTRPSSYFAPDDPAETLFSHPGPWLENMVDQVCLMIKELANYLIKAFYLIILLIAVLCLALKSKGSFLKCKTNAAFFAFFLCILASVVVLILVHYLDNTRYYAPFFCLFIVLASLMLRKLRTPGFIALFSLLFCSAVYHNYMSYFFNKSYVKRIIRVRTHPQEQRDTMMNLTPQAEMVRDYILARKPDAYLCASFAKKLKIERFAFKSGVRFTVMPTNINSAKHLMQYFDEFRTEYFYYEADANHFYPDGMPFVEECISKGVLVPSGVEHLYELDKEKIRGILQESNAA